MRITFAAGVGFQVLRICWAGLRGPQASFAEMDSAGGVYYSSHGEHTDTRAKDAASQLSPPPPPNCRDRPLGQLFEDDPAQGLTPQEILNAEPPPFGPDFAWGAATSAYQIEGAWKEGGRGPSIWDTFSHTQGSVKNNENGDVACDHYHRWKDDVKLIKSLGHTHYRMSISWSRIMPTGRQPVNEAGLQFYKDLIGALVSEGIQPSVTLYHWDLPQALQDKGGWQNPATVKAFTEFADVCFGELGPLGVKMWATINEPWSISILGHGLGGQAPGIKDLKQGVYTVGHNLMLAHAATAKLYKERYKAEQKGEVGIVLSVQYKVPLCDNNQSDHMAAERNLQFYLGWFAAPLFKGDYPQVMKERVGARLPVFTEEEKQDLKGSADFLGVNTYSSSMCTNRPVIADCPAHCSSYWDDVSTRNTYDPSWPRAQSSWLYVYPPGMRGTLRWIKKEYGDLKIYITENGVSVPNESALTHDQALQDDFRVNYMEAYIAEMAKAMKYDGVDVRGYFVWSLMDNFEWQEGYNERFGIVHVDFLTQERRPKKSALWYKDLINKYRSLQGGAVAAPDK